MIDKVPENEKNTLRLAIADLSVFFALSFCCIHLLFSFSRCLNIAHAFGTVTKSEHAPIRSTAGASKDQSLHLSG